VSDLQIILIAIVTVVAIIGPIGLFTLLSMRSSFRRSDESDARLNQAVIAMGFETQKMIRQSEAASERNQARVLEIIKPMNQILARIHETTETYFGDSVDEDE